MYNADFALTQLQSSVDGGKFGSVTRELEEIQEERRRLLSRLSLESPVNLPVNSAETSPVFASEPISQKFATSPASGVRNLQVDVINLDDDDDVPDGNTGSGSNVVVLLDSDEEGETEQKASMGRFPLIIASQVESFNRHVPSSGSKDLFNQLVLYDGGLDNVRPLRQDLQPALFDKLESPRYFMDWEPSNAFQKVVLQKIPEGVKFHDVVNEKDAETKSEHTDKVLGDIMSAKKKTKVGRKRKIAEPSSLIMGTQTPALPLCLGDNPTSMQNPEENEVEASPSDGLDDLWKDMSFAMECSKIPTEDEPNSPEQDEDCGHTFLLQDDIGLVCGRCGIIQKRIETIFDFQWTKGNQSIRTYASGSRDSKSLNDAVQLENKILEDDFAIAEVSMHPRHLKQIKPHQLEGFNFLLRNLITDKPGGCILAHAPGSGKTFMIITFIQSFLAKYPSYRPLVVLPKGILPIWKKEFQRWQVEDIPLYDFYSSKADSRIQQLEILKLWQENKSILFLGYKQFSTIICSNEKSNAATSCQEILLKVPNLLILDEGHTPRNEDTNMLGSLAKVQTPRKVVLSGTLFQNHVREVFNILNLVRPRFIKTESSRAIVKRMLSRVHISGGRKFYKGGVDNTFYDLVEENLQKSDNFNRKITVIQDLREMTKDVLHYYKGDFLDELPGLVDFTVVLNLTPKQKALVKRFDKYDKFKRISVGSAVYLHPQLSEAAERATGDRVAYITDDKVDSLLDSINIKDGVKAKFFLNILSLAESAGEKVLAFSQYILPMKFLERLIVSTKGWKVGKEIFMITGDSSPELREWSMEQFNSSPDAKVFFGSIKACGEGISLVGASRIVILDVHLNPSVTRQAIGRAFRPGQTKKVYSYRLVSADSPEEEDHNTAFTKELVSKLWFEWNKYSNEDDFQLKPLNIESCDDLFLESPILREDVKALYRR